ncbi:Fe-S oxidoreductase [Pseudoroseomonas deserti]|uniref:Fe-S oxidoreductase n=1 Tax=Teichococcus deserti TaxID=1817963 RepID=A0A1V2H7Q7_9PROT|nr:DUF1987 domain-containing protein [Pseudoroseomonas deserti]ONG58877.1 Fe-S oxidoreductase [Pseudoroseomonas deserti]
MDRILLEATDRSPKVDFDFAGGRFALEGEAYPEDAAAFFGPLLQGLKQHVQAQPAAAIRFDVALSYFNSSSAKALMNLFMVLEEAAAAGAAVAIGWHYQEGDDSLQEAGEDFSADFTHARFEMIETPA